MTLDDYAEKLMTKQIVKSNMRLARRIWGDLSRASLLALKELTGMHNLSVSSGHLQFLDGRWYVTHAGLLRLASRRRCVGIRVQPVREFCDMTAERWAFKATLYKSPTCKGFVGYGDADPSNVSPLVRGAVMRVAETRAVNRALRKAYGIGLCSVEELGAQTSPPKPPARVTKTVSAQQLSSGNNNGQPLLRDRLCLLIRRYRLDPEQVKRYAADFCGTEALKEASREMVEDFINQLAEWAARDREGLLCHLNRYTKAAESSEPKEVAS